MLKDDNPPKEPARNKAIRKWRNHSVEKSIKEERQKASAEPPEPKELEVGDVIENDKVMVGELVRAQTKFAKDIRDMLKHHTLRNTLLYKLSLRHQRKRLLYEKLKRLQAKAALRDQEASNA